MPSLDLQSAARGSRYPHAVPKYLQRVDRYRPLQSCPLGGYPHQIPPRRGLRPIARDLAKSRT
ncbi:hypothetical protein B0H17DRAFT_1076944 [Mycena rosella]|uniref:Uncharacterized protein n=1 Tax=Mycena rosella TaxID=1033263 RepID=A0AAD7D5M9_MYCRO|nr:hypothetical protein B0H17DRAFT_1076944 [Mycena rosella]